MPATCSSCGQPIDVHQQVRGGTCNAIECRAKAAKRHHASRNAERETLELAVAAAHLRTLLGAGRSAESVTLVVVSGSSADLQPVSPARRENLRNNLAASIVNSEQLQLEPARREPPAAECAPATEALIAACATCRGFCCRDGSDSAYLDASTLRRIRAEHPTLSPEEIIEMYVAAIPRHSVERSCIFHGAQGCTLPRELRSHTCNDYFCQPLRNWIGRATPQDAAVVIMQGEQVLRSALIS